MISKFGKIYITIEVYEELSRCKSLIKPLIDEIEKGNIKVMESADYSYLQKRYPRLGAGELSVISSTKEGKCKIAFIEDRDAENAAKNENLHVFNIPEILLAYKKKGLIERKEITKIINDLKEKDGYVLKKEIEEELIR